MKKQNKKEKHKECILVEARSASKLKTQLVYRADLVVTYHVTQDKDANFVATFVNRKNRHGMAGKSMKITIDPTLSTVLFSKD